MPVTDTSLATSTNFADNPTAANPNGVLGKDDFLKLLLVELQYQDPTEPMDSEKILSQTSQLATLEASENTNKVLEELADSLQSSSQLSTQFSTIAAIGKIADTGSNGMLYETGESKTFEIYFPEEIASGNVEIKDANGNVMRTIEIDPNDKGVYSFDWNGITNSGDAADSGVYYIEASYANNAGDTLKTRAGAYPIESVRFDDGETLVKLGSSYVPLSSIQEVYQ